MTKSLLLRSGRSFPTLSAAKSHFHQLLEGQPLKVPFEGEDLVEIEATFVAYCAETNWPVSSPPKSFYPTNNRGRGYTTRCYGVMFNDGRSDTFSMDKALTAIAR
jgi:hypothetical protein